MKSLNLSLEVKYLTLLISKKNPFDGIHLTKSLIRKYKE